MKRREFAQSAAASVALGPLRQIDSEPDNADDSEEVQILLRMSTEQYNRLRERGELYQAERGIWKFIPSEHRE
jgi:hypothetical protein